MKISDCLRCENFPCGDINVNAHRIPDANFDPLAIRLMMIAESPPPVSSDYFYAAGRPFFIETTAQAFGDAGFKVNDISDILKLGIYITTAIKCAKADYYIRAETIHNCSEILEREFHFFTRLKAVLLMGDTAIRAFNHIGLRQNGRRVIPAGSTYKIRCRPYFYQQLRIFPSYLMTGRNYLIEASKRRMIAQDIGAAALLL